MRIITRLDEKEIPLTLAATDHEVALDPTKTTSDDVPPLSLTYVFAHNSPCAQISEMDFLIDIEY